LVSLRLAQHDPQAATAALAPAIDGSVGSQPFSVVAALLLEAAARDALRDPAAAGRALERALDLAGPGCGGRGHRTLRATHGRGHLAWHPATPDLANGFATTGLD